MCSKNIQKYVWKSPFETLESLPRVPTQIVPIFDNFSDVNKICFHPKIANCPSLLSVACCDEVYLLSYKLEGGLSCRAESVSKSLEVNEFKKHSNSQLLKLKLKYSFSEITTLRSVMAKWHIYGCEIPFYPPFPWNTVLSTWFWTDPKRTLELERCFRYSGGRKIIVPNLRHFFYFFKIIVFFWPTKDWPILRLMTIL